MGYVRKIGLWFALAFFGFGISLFTFGFTASQTIGRPEVLKAWLEDAAVYEGLVSVASEVEVDTGSTDGQEGLLTADILRESAIKVFEPEVIQVWIEDIIDGTYVWLNGDSQKPEFSIDTRDTKQRFAEEASGRVEASYQSLPLCTSQQQALAAQADPVNATCQVLGINPDVALRELEEEIITDESFLSEGIYNADNISFNGEETPAYITFSAAPDYFEWLKRAPYIASVAIVFGAILTLVLARSVRIGARKLGFRMITGSVFGLFGSVVLLFGLRTLSGVADTSNATAVEDVVVPFVNEMIPDFILYSAAVSGVVLVLGIVLLVVARQRKPESTGTQNSSRGKDGRADQNLVGVESPEKTKN